MIDSAALHVMEYIGGGFDSVHMCDTTMPECAAGLLHFSECIIMRQAVARL